MSSKLKQNSKTPKFRTLGNTNYSEENLESSLHAIKTNIFHICNSRHSEKDSQKLSHGERPQRSSKWLLVTPNQPQSDLTTQRHDGNNGNSSISIKIVTPKPRPSKFLEGSMNDRVSLKPPMPYLDPIDDLPPDSKTKKRSSLKGFANMDRWDFRETPTNRLRKSIAATFNLRQWKFWSRNPDDKTAEEYADHQIMVERQEKARKAYKKYTESGQFQDYNAGLLFGEKKSIRIHSLDTDRIDSGVGLWEKNLSPEYTDKISEEVSTPRRQGKNFVKLPLNTQCENPNDRTRILRLSSSVADFDYPPRSRPSSFIKSPSMMSLYKIFNGAMGSSSNNSIPSEESTSNTPKALSRRGLQRQQKLVKRVSNLEVKLEEAHKQLYLLKSGNTDHRRHHSYQPYSLKKRWSLGSMKLDNDNVPPDPLSLRKHTRSISYSNLVPNPFLYPSGAKLRKRSTSVPYKNNELFPPSSPIKPIDADSTGDENFFQSTSVDLDQDTRLISHFSDSDDDTCKKSSKDCFHRLSNPKKKQGIFEFQPRKRKNSH